MIILNDILIIFGLSALIIFIFHYLRLPVIIGLLASGFIVGPHGLKLIHNAHEVEVLAEIGVVLLLFTIGIEFSLKNLMRIKRAVLLGGSLQVGLTTMILIGVALLFCQSLGTAIFMGFLVSLSSTAIVMKLYQERSEVESPHGRIGLAILIFQDIAIVIMMLMVPILTGNSPNIGWQLLILLIKGAAIIAFVFISAQFIVPAVFYQITRTRSQELFLISIVLLCLAVAWITYSAKLSLALGAFLAGLIISESEYSHQAMAGMKPFRDVFTSFFFVSIGMLLNLELVGQYWWKISYLTGGVIIFKTVLIAGVVIALGYPLKVALLTGLGISQIGEFAFVLAKSGVDAHLIGMEFYQIFLAMSILTMILTPFLINLAPWFTKLLVRLPWPEKIIAGLYGYSESSSTATTKKTDHLVIIGYGMNGRNLAKAAKLSKIEYEIIEMNPETVKRQKRNGESIHYGDAAQEAVLDVVNIKDARIAVIAISDLMATRAITQAVYKLNRKIHLIVRTRFFQEVQELYALGASVVIPEEYETSIEIFTQVLTRYLVPQQEIDQIVAQTRADGYQVFRSFNQSSPTVCDFQINMPNLEIKSFRVHPESTAAGQTLKELQLRNRFSVNVLAIRRDNDILTDPGAQTIIKPDDVVILLGRPENLKQSASLFML